MKLQNFPKAYCISLEESKDRQKHLLSQFKKYGVKNFHISKCKRFDQCGDVINGSLVHTLTNSNKGASSSHLKSIKKWLSESDETERYAIFFEDDISFETVDYWNFTWDDFMNNIPKDWDVIQLMWVRPHMVKVEFRERYPDDWSATAFMITREYGRKLLETYMVSDTEFNYELGNLQPIVENVIYCLGALGKVYTCPLFVEATHLETTFVNSSDSDIDSIVDGQTKNHHHSQQSVLNWWKNVGSKISLDKIINTNTLPASFSWSGLSINEVNEIKRDLCRNNIYERFNPVEPNDIVVDIGSGIGQFACSILKKQPHSIYCVESRENYFPTLVTNTSKFSIKTPAIFSNKKILKEPEYSFMDFIEEHEISKINYLKIDRSENILNILNSDSIDWILNNVEKIMIRMNLNSESKNDFQIFRDNYIELFKNYFIMSDAGQNIHPGYDLNLTTWIFDGSFFDKFFGDIKIYISN